MACFLVSAAEAVVITAVEKAQEKKEETLALKGESEKSPAVPLSKKLQWLRNMLLGGVVMLMFEHIWHGEVVPYFPFLTAMYDAEETSVMLHEMATVGVSMAALITVVWAVVCVVADMKAKNLSREASEA